jgi:hypothetical protein
VEQNVYVDDYYRGRKEVQEVVNEFVDVRNAMKLSSLHLGKVMSNSKEILAKFPDEEKAPKFGKIDAKDSQSLPSTKALGVRWDCEKDIFCFSTRATAKTPKNVSEVLSQLASTYDPLQTIAPYLMTGKLLLQQFWRNVEDWKKPLTEEQQERWVPWMMGLAEIEVLHVPWLYGFPKGTVVTLSSCSNASDVGYGASAYFHVPAMTRPLLQQRARSLARSHRFPAASCRHLSPAVVWQRRSSKRQKELSPSERWSSGSTAPQGTSG